MEEEFQLSEGSFMSAIFVGKNTEFLMKKLGFVKIVGIIPFLKLPIVSMRKEIWCFTGKKAGNQT